MPARHPNVLWAQRRDHVYLTIDLQVKQGEGKGRGKGERRHARLAEAEARLMGWTWVGGTGGLGPAGCGAQAVVRYLSPHAGRRER